MSVKGAQERITQAATAWDGVTAQPHRFGGVEYVIGRRDIGHIHGDQWVDIAFPKKIRDELVAAGRANPHHILPATGWVSFYLQQDDDVDKAIELPHENFVIAMRQNQKRNFATYPPNPMDLGDMSVRKVDFTFALFCAPCN